MNKKEFVSVLAAKKAENDVANGVENGVASKRVATQWLEAFMDAMNDTLASGESVKLVGFGNFEVAERAERNGVNPSNGEPIVIPAHKTVKFKASSTLKDKMNV